MPIGALMPLRVALTASKARLLKSVNACCSSSSFSISFFSWNCASPFLSAASLECLKRGCTTLRSEVPGASSVSVSMECTDSKSCCTHITVVSISCDICAAVDCGPLPPGSEVAPSAAMPPATPRGRAVGEDAAVPTASGASLGAGKLAVLAPVAPPPSPASSETPAEGGGAAAACCAETGAAGGIGEGGATDSPVPAPSGSFAFFAFGGGLSIAARSRCISNCAEVISASEAAASPAWMAARACSAVCSASPTAAQISCACRSVARISSTNCAEASENFGFSVANTTPSRLPDSMAPSPRKPRAPAGDEKSTSQTSGSRRLP
mmetsp:Transcript_65726/g.145505  ORF Transcript_65726/g.145505 Transcript_65726/m.145505 type:complete len:323 (+) Transcript_65726:80-1048(+)